MGINDLWLALSPASHNRTLTQLTISEGFEVQRRSDCCLRIGVDSSVWMNQAQLANNNKQSKRRIGTRAGENPAVRTLFYRLCRLLTLPIVPIFVFDGPRRPSMKRNTAVKTKKPHWLTLPFQKFIEAFGFSWYMAPGEAEAELAELNRRDQIDAIISEDSDAMVFGARCVIRMKNVQEVGDRITVFDVKSIEAHPDVSLDHGALFFMAILCGGDYHKAGLSGCGWKTACRLARTELAHSLFVVAVSSPSHEALRAFLPEWRESFRTLLAQDPDNKLGKRYPSLAQKVTDEFPCTDVLLQYAQPVTSWTIGQTPDQSLWYFRQPCFAEIGVLCEKYFSWGSSGDMASRCKETLWPGIVVRYLVAQRNLNTSNVHKAVMDHADAANFKGESSSIMNVHILRIFQSRLGPGPSTTHPDVHGYTIQISTHILLRDNIARLDASIQSLAMKQSSINTSFWVPASILQAAVPDLVKRFKGKQPKLPTAYPQLLVPSLDNNSEDASDVMFIEGTSQPVPKPKHLGFFDLSVDVPPSIQWADNDPAIKAEFVEGSSAIGATCGSDHDSDIEIIEGPFKPKPKFLGFLDLCTPSPSPSL
ncbi:PIN domain-like protein [Pholiota molesta]|nr:PIN domain-like protein [Pholiota molesta]